MEQQYIQPTVDQSFAPQQQVPMQQVPMQQPMVQQDPLQQPIQQPMMQQDTMQQPMQQMQQAPMTEDWNSLSFGDKMYRRAFGNPEVNQTTGEKAKHFFLGPKNVPAEDIHETHAGQVSHDLYKGVNYGNKLARCPKEVNYAHNHPEYQ